MPALAEFGQECCRGGDAVTALRLLRPTSGKHATAERRGTLVCHDAPPS